MYDRYHRVAQQNHWSECGRVTSVRSPDAVGRPHRSVQPLREQNYLQLCQPRKWILKSSGP